MRIFFRKVKTSRRFTPAQNVFDTQIAAAFLGYGHQAGLATGTRGLPVGGGFTSLVDGTTVFQFQAYTGNNVLQLSSSASSGPGNSPRPGIELSAGCQSVTGLPQTASAPAGPA